MERASLEHFGKMEDPYQPDQLAREINERKDELDAMMDNLEVLSGHGDWLFSVGEIIESAEARGLAEGWPPEEVAALTRAIRGYQARLDQFGEAIAEQSKEIQEATKALNGLLDAVEKINAPGGKA